MHNFQVMQSSPAAKLRAMEGKILVAEPPWIAPPDAMIGMAATWLPVIPKMMKKAGLGACTHCR
jgi:hypothetical protein